MAMEENGKGGSATGEMLSSVKEYISLKIDETKLKGVEGMALFCSRLLYIFLAALTILIAFILFALALGFLLGEYLGSDSLGFTAVGILFIILFGILYLFRKRLFLNGLVRFFIKILFDDNSR